MTRVNSYCALLQNGSRKPRLPFRDTASRVSNKGRNIQMLHKVEELKWVVMWLLITIFVFAVFIPQVNKALNL